AGAWVRGEKKGAGEHARHRQVIDVAMIAEHESFAIITRQAASHAARSIEFGQRFAAFERAYRQLDGIDDLSVARAAADVWGERALDRGARRLGAFVDQVFGPHDDAGDAEPALQAAGRDERAGEGVALNLAQAFKRVDALARHFAGRHGAG